MTAKPEMVNEVDMAVDDIKRLAAAVKREPEDGAAREAPFLQRDHDVMLAALDHVADDWITQLQETRKNSEHVEQLVLERVSKLKTDVTQLFVLGAAVRAEAKRGEDVNTKLREELAKLESLP